MPENCESACPALTRLEQQVDLIREQNSGGLDRAGKFGKG